MHWQCWSVGYDTDRYRGWFFDEICKKTETSFMPATMRLHQFFVETDKIKSFFELHSIPLLNVSSIPGKLKEVNSSLDGKEQDDCFKQEIFPGFVQF
jgi:hypothetical protein